MRSYPILNRYGTCEEAGAALLQFAVNLSDTFGWSKVTKQENGGFAFRFPAGNACAYLSAGIVKDVDISEVYSLKCDVFIEASGASRTYIGGCTFNDVTAKGYNNPWHGDLELIDYAIGEAKRIGKKL